LIATATVVLGLLLLIGGGTAMVHGASQAATRLGWSPMVVGLTIVGFGTSAPELVVSLVAAAEGVSEIVFGNVIGSNICNIGLILGLAALIAPLEIQDQIVRRELPLLPRLRSSGWRLSRSSGRSTTKTVRPAPF
jgi:cation:H+ antiporter